MNEFSYVGTELELFETAVNWKRYLQHQLSGYIRGAVLEVGAGIGANTQWFGGCSFESWLCLEPDHRLLDRLVSRGCWDERYDWLTGTMATMGPQKPFDTVLYIDVLEHIEDDQAELAAASSQLAQDGTLVVVSPAYQWLYSEFDSAVGHHRRYSTTSLSRIAPSDLKLDRLEYLDSCGLFASLANKVFLHKPVPSAGDILMWDRILVPCSRIADRLFLRKCGRSVLGVWHKE